MPETLDVALTSGTGADLFARGTALARFIDAQIYETLVHLDCEGNLVPALAQSWSSDATARTTFRLRDDARFWNGEVVTARDVVASWQRTASTAQDPAAASVARTLVDVVSLVDDRALAVPEADVRMLADPALAVNRLTPGAQWPEGTGGYRIASIPGEGTVELTPVVQRSSTPTSRVVVRAVSSATARDRIDAGADLMIASDPSVTSYAAARPELRAVALPWNTTYVLLVPRRAASSPPALASQSPSAADTLRAALARDAVRADARAATPPYWWREARRCALEIRGSRTDALQQPAAPYSAGRIVYRNDDPVARQLAQRLVALAGMSASNTSSALAALAPGLVVAAPLVAEGLDASHFAAALSAGQALSYVVALPARPVAACQRLQGLFAAAPWLPDDSAIVPLIDTHATAIVRRVPLSFVIDWDGSVRVDAVGRRSTSRTPDR